MSKDNPVSVPKLIDMVEKLSREKRELELEVSYLKGIVVYMVHHPLSSAEIKKVIDDRRS